nr:hypothetical protein [Rhodobacter sp.]
MLSRAIFLLLSSSSSLSSSHPPSSPSSSDADYYYEPSYSGNDTYTYYDGEYPSSTNASSSSSAPFPMPAFTGGGGGDSFGVCDCAVCQAKPEMRPPDYSPLSRYLWSQKMQPTPE